MKQRIITGVACATLLIPILLFFDTYFYNAVLAVFSGAAAFEALQAVGIHKKLTPVILTVLFAAAALFCGYEYFLILLCAYTVLFFTVLILPKDVENYAKAAMVYPIIIMVMVGFASLIYLRDMTGHGMFYLFIVMIGSWMTDIGAYFIGSFFGKHKLIEHISPKKTVEGAVGGFVCCMLAIIAASLIYQFVFLKDTAQISYWLMALIAIVLSVIGMIGDLAASLIKRACHIKDYGNILPGHGGVLDRVDSFIFVVPFTLFAAIYLPLIVAR